MKFLFLVLLVISCSPSHQAITDYSLPEELKDCKVYIISDGRKELYVVDCPNKQNVTTSFTSSCGKNCTTTEATTLIRR